MIDSEILKLFNQTNEAIEGTSLALIKMTFTQLKCYQQKHKETIDPYINGQINQALQKLLEKREDIDPHDAQKDQAELDKRHKKENDKKLNAQLSMFLIDRATMFVEKTEGSRDDIRPTYDILKELLFDVLDH